MFEVLAELEYEGRSFYVIYKVNTDEPAEIMERTENGSLQVIDDLNLYTVLSQDYKQAVGSQNEEEKRT
ncbi:hypothetical protein DNH61_07015 [Paenibacillus sambharensis]|uniref:DUF1292 domain-containing protein n=1 Tax=Paenibacillus sambharensis TaxID=1803190 RepID=A0A2W1LBF6_9BACL|nr:hypothetical protein [Paenibacillus sambharensis]PZD96546.1 hypothetical protein DNH61_07015 [Paenibacillus sambharensis]